MVDKIFDRLRPEGCEWLRRPNTAISELGSSLNENFPLLEGDTHFLDQQKVHEFIHRLQSFSDLLKKIHRDYEGPNTEQDKRDAALSIVNPSQEIRDAMLAVINVGGALFTMGINFMVANRLFANPVNFTNLMTFAPLPDSVFKMTKNILDLLPLLHVPKAVVPTEQQPASVQHIGMRACFVIGPL